MGYLILIILGLLGMVGLAMAGVRRPLWSMAGAALMLGAIGYTVQGRPFTPGRPAQPDAAVAQLDPGLIDLRARMLGRYTADNAYLIAADAMERAGEPRAAVRVMLGGIAKYRGSLMLWVGLGEALSRHDGNRMSPPALFAFQQASRINPMHPGPPFFQGLAHVRAGEFAAARPLWARALALTPAGVSYHRDIAVRLAALDRYLAQTR